MNIFTFTAHFSSEQACRSHFKEQRDAQGVVCKKCGSSAHYWKSDKECYEFKSCGFRTTLRGGTIMEHSNLSFLIWYRAMFLMSVTKKGFSAKEMQRQLGLKRYEPVWAMVHKLRKAMGNRDARYTLDGMIEMDEGYFTVSSTEVEQSQGRRGRGAAGKQNVMVSAESTPLEDPQTGKKSKHVRYFKAKVLEDHTADEINMQIKESFNEKSIVFTDKSTSYVDIADYVEMHVNEKSTKESTTETLR